MVDFHGPMTVLLEELSEVADGNPGSLWIDYLSGDEKVGSAQVDCVSDRVFINEFYPYSYLDE